MYCIKTHSSILQDFVSNRESEIQVYWWNVKIKQNPADRGNNVNELNTSIWLDDAQFLLRDATLRPIDIYFLLSSEGTKSWRRRSAFRRSTPLRLRSKKQILSSLERLLATGLLYILLICAEIEFNQSSEENIRCACVKQAPSPMLRSP